jgi:hypothetical protein
MVPARRAERDDYLIPRRLVDFIDPPARKEPYFPRYRAQKRAVKSHRVTSVRLVALFSQKY